MTSDRDQRLMVSTDDCEALTELLFPHMSGSGLSKDTVGYDMAQYEASRLAGIVVAAGWRPPEPTVCGSHIIYRGARLACDLTPNGIPHEHHGKPRTPGPHIYWGDVDDGLALE